MKYWLGLFPLAMGFAMAASPTLAQPPQQDTCLRCHRIIDEEAYSRPVEDSRTTFTPRRALDARLATGATRPCSGRRQRIPAGATSVSLPEGGSPSSAAAVIPTHSS